MDLKYCILKLLSHFPKKILESRVRVPGEILNSRALLSEHRAVRFSTEDVAFLQQRRMARSLAPKRLPAVFCLAWRCPSRCGVSGYSARRTCCDKVLRAHSSQSVSELGCECQHKMQILGGTALKQMTNLSLNMLTLSPVQSLKEGEVHS